MQAFRLKIKHSLFYILIFSLALCSNGLTQEEKANNNLLIIVDSSRSMLQLTSDGKEKLRAAKMAVSKLIDKLPTDTNVGLMVFGHREKDKCDDIELVLPIAALNKTAIEKKLEFLKPTGVTPLTTSLDKAAQHLEKLRGKSTILLLTDGKETCGGDPVEVVSNMSNKYGIILIVDVVGLNVTSMESRQLESIAKAGGGNYYSANTSYELVSAITDVVEQIVIEVGGTEKKKKQEKEERDKTVEDDELGTLVINYNHILSSISIYDKNTDERVEGRVMWVHLESTYSTNLEPGRYRIELYSPFQEVPIEIQNVEIKRNRKTTINVE